MIKKAYIFFFFLFFSKAFLYGQYCDTSVFQKIIWNQNVHDARVKNIFFNDAGNIYILGTTQSPTNGSNDIWVMKTTPGAKVIWSKSIGMQKNEKISGARNTDDGGFIIDGTTNSLSTFDQGWIMKLDSNANIQWSVLLGTKYSSLSQLTQLDDGSYVVCGTLYTNFSGDSSGRVIQINNRTNVILKLDKNGNTVWWKSFRFGALEGLRTIIQLNDENLLVTGTADNTNDVYILKLNQLNGDIIWMNQFVNPNPVFFRVPLKEATKPFT